MKRRRSNKGKILLRRERRRKEQWKVDVCRELEDMRYEIGRKRRERARKIDK